MWARDLRASKVAGHSGKKSTRIYDRAVVEAADRFAEARVKGRERSGNDGGNAR